MVPSFAGNVGFNAHHAPMGAYFTFTCGHFGTRGGMGVQLGKPANQDLFIGIKEGDRHAPGPCKVLPFFDGAEKLTPQANFTPEAATTAPAGLVAYGREQIVRRYGWATDTWETPDFVFRLLTPFGEIPEPGVAPLDAVRDALLPAITAELEIDNRTGAATKTAFFAINFQDGGCRVLEGLGEKRVGFAFRAQLGVAAETDGPAPFLFMRWSVEEALGDRSNPVHLLGICPGIGVEVPPGERVTLRIALGCHLADTVTTRLEGRYLYTRHYANLEAVLAAALARFDALAAAARTLDAQLLASGLSHDQQFLIAHATRSYYANTELLDIAGQPWWIVNEGEYCMMNTLDLAADQVFWELERNPWVVRNLLDNFHKHYSYTDQVKGPDGAVAPGGISFTHDQGTHNQFSPFGQSAYELKNLTGCFSYMTQEQLCNWILIAASYVAVTRDTTWATDRLETFSACLRSMIRRDAEEADGGVGNMRWDSARCGLGEEITTYDSLDASLGRARSNLYIAAKRWIAFEGLAILLGAHDFALQQISAATTESDRAARFLLTQVHATGFIPSLLDRRADGARILPAVEPLAFAMCWESHIAPRYTSDETPELPVKFAGSRIRADSPSAHLLNLLKNHTENLLADPARRNHFPDGGIRLSSTSDNSWLSKIALVQHIARTLFNLDENGTPRPQDAAATRWEKADAAHVAWLTTGPGAYWCACDQIVSGVARGSKYYPRLITTALWLRESRP
jgi:hypothetical protein